MIPMRIETLRFNQFDELNYASKIGYHRNFGDNDVVKKSIESTVTSEDIKFINIWNPKYAIDQIEQLENGVQGYNGQILYYSGAGSNTYPIPQLQSAINYVLSDVENSILVRKETSTGFISSYLLFIFIYLLILLNNYLFSYLLLLFYIKLKLSSNEDV